MKKFKTIIVLILIQACIISGIVYAGPSAFSDTLSPQLSVQTSQIQHLFTFYSPHQFPNKDIPSVSKQAVYESADNLEQGYEKLNTIISKLLKDNKKPLIICIDGGMSAGKTTFSNRIKEKAIAGISIRDIAFIDVDALKNDEYQKDYNPLDAILNLPIALSKKIDIEKDKRLIVVEGRESVDYLRDISCIPDIAVLLKASTKVKLKRHIMRYGLLGIKFLSEDKINDYTPKGIISLSITTDQHIPLYEFLSLAGIKTISKTLEYVMPEFVVDYFSDKADIFKTSLNKAIFDRFKSNEGSVSIVEMLVLPLKLFFYLVNQMVNLYYLFHKDGDIISIIKNKFKDKHIKVLDVGTGEGSFVEKFQALLNEKGIDAKVLGIDIKLMRIIKGLRRKRNVRILNIIEAEKEFGRNSFDLITINAPDSAEGCAREAMKVLNPGGVLILRLAKWYHTSEDRERMIQSFKKDFEVRVLAKSFYNLPEGDYYKLQKPILISLKNSLPEQDDPKNSADNIPAGSAKVYEFKTALNNQKTNVSALVKKGKEIIDIAPGKTDNNKSGFLKLAPLISTADKKAHEFINQAI
ncbi:MAG: class I SAM-dependent methyltransferase [Candidatus Omnitrophica bacterium]|nr:class I SAM-dependent methyltransferase [Candidatus Omnitrophota bacterium]